MKMLWIISVVSDITDKLFVTYSAFFTRERVGVQWNSTSAIFKLQESLLFRFKLQMPGAILPLPKCPMMWYVITPYTHNFTFTYNSVKTKIGMHTKLVMLTKI